MTLIRVGARIGGRSAKKPAAKVLFVLSTLAPEGPVRQLYDLIKYLDKTAFLPRILTLSPEPPGSLMPHFQELGVPCHTLGLSRAAGMVFGLVRLRRFLHCCPADIVHTHGVRADILSGLGLRGLARVSTRHCDFFESTLIEHGPLFGSALDRIVLSALGRLDRVAFVSNDNCRKAQRARRLRAVAVRNGVDEEVFSPVSANRKKQLRGSLGLSPDGVICIAVGHLSRRKDPLTVLRGFLLSTLAERGILVLLGDGPLRSACEHVGNGASNVRILGQVQSVAGYLQAADVFVSASLSEGIGLDVIEAMACGLPVVLSDIGPHREMWELDTQAGALFPVADVSALAERLRLVTDAHYPSRSRAAMGIVRTHLNARAMAAQYQSLYAGCLEDHVHAQDA